MKAIIGPDQYVVFLENFYLNGGQGHGNGKAIRGQKGNGHHGHFARNGKNRNGKGMNRADKAQQTATEVNAAGAAS